MAASRLPFDCLILCMKILPFRDRVICESVCQEWMIAAKECTSTYQTSVCIFSRKENVDKDCIQNFCYDPSHEISFEQDCIFATDSLPVMSILSKCKNLKVLHFKCYEEECLDTERIEELHIECPKIEHFSMSDDTRGCYIYKDCLTLVQNCVMLTHLQLRFPGESTLDFLLENAILHKSLLMHGNRITSLSTNLPLNDDNCSLLTQCPLNQLFIQGTSTTLEGLTMICTSPNQSIQELSIVVDWIIQLNLISEMMSNLKCLRCTIANDEIPSVKCLSLLKNLRILFLSVWSKNNLDDDMIEIMTGCKKLQSLTVNGEVTDTCLAQLSQLCPKIQRLEIALNSDAKKITDQTIESFRQLPKLRYLSLRNCDVTDTGFQILLSSCRCLTFVRLSAAPQLTFSVILMLQHYARENMRRRVKAVLPQALVPGHTVGEGVQHEIECPNLCILFE